MADLVNLNNTTLKARTSEGELNAIRWGIPLSLDHGKKQVEAWFADACAVIVMHKREAGDIGLFIKACGEQDPPIELMNKDANAHLDGMNTDKSLEEASFLEAKRKAIMTLDMNPQANMDGARVKPGAPAMHNVYVYFKNQHHLNRAVVLGTEHDWRHGEGWFDKIQPLASLTDFTNYKQGVNAEATKNDSNASISSMDVLAPYYVRIQLGKSLKSYYKYISNETKAHAQAYTMECLSAYKGNQKREKQAGASLSGNAVGITSVQKKRDYDSSIIGKIAINMKVGQLAADHQKPDAKAVKAAKLNTDREAMEAESAEFESMFEEASTVSESAQKRIQEEANQKMARWKVWMKQKEAQRETALANAAFAEGVRLHKLREAEQSRKKPINRNLDVSELSGETEAELTADAEDAASITRDSATKRRSPVPGIDDNQKKLKVMTSAPPRHRR